MRPTKNSLVLFQSPDSILQRAVNELIRTHKCHTVILYGSRARGEGTKASDYDLLGVRKTGKKLRYAIKLDGAYLDAFILPEQALRKIGEEHLYMKDAKVLIQKGRFGDVIVGKLKSALKKPYKPLPADELEARRVWPYKMLERIRIGDIEGNYRRSWLHEALLSDYFELRQKRYCGPKESFRWLKENDHRSYQLFDRVLSDPKDLRLLEKLIEQVTQT